MRIKDLYKQDFIKQNLEGIVSISGRVQFNRSGKKIGFINLFDGTNFNGVQIVYKSENDEVFSQLSKANAQTYIKLNGVLKQSQRNIIEIECSKIIYLKESSHKYPLGKKEHSLETLREYATLRPRTSLINSIMKIRSSLVFGVYEFFNKFGFINVSTPILTSNDSEGAGETFSVTSENKLFNLDPSLTVSGQLHVETYAQIYSKVFTFSPTFRAENSNTQMHASEFWMLEPEIIDYDYLKTIKHIEKLLSFLATKILNNFPNEIELLSKHFGIDLLGRLQNLQQENIDIITYKDALSILNKASINSKGNLFHETNFEFGLDLAKEHEKYLTDVHFNKPIFLIDYPKKIKAFYMYQNDDNETVRAFDLLVPGIGELVGGSQREERIDYLQKSMMDKDIQIDSLDWYINLREYGYAPSTGYGLGFERLVMYFTGTSNIRDVLPFPRTPGKINY